MSVDDKETLNEDDWRRLARTVQTGKCVLLLGPGVVVDPDHDGRTPLTTLLARTLAEKLGPDALIVNKDDLAHVAQVYTQTGTGRDRYDLEVAVSDFYRQYADKTTSLHRELAELPFTLCVTTTPDAFMAKAFRDAKKEPLVEFYNFRQKRNIGLPGPDPQKPVVYGLYGDISDLTSLILTESELLDFLVHVIDKTQPLPSALTERFSGQDVSFLFLGFGFQQWHVRILLHVLRSGEPHARSLALEGPSFFEFPGQREIAVFYGRQHAIAFKLFSWEDFVKELRQHHDALVGERCPAVGPPPTEAPLLFLCHSHDDKDAVVALANALQAAGLRVWLDQKNLRGGDEWDPKISAVVGKEVDYIVVIQSTRMQQRVESYVYKELRTALERQKGFAAGFRFIVPVTLEPCEGLSELRHLHFIDVSTPAGVQSLADTVTNDWNHRHAVPQLENS